MASVEGGFQKPREEAREVAESIRCSLRGEGGRRRRVASYLCRRLRGRQGAAAATAAGMQRPLVPQTAPGGYPLLATSPSLPSSSGRGTRDPALCGCSGCPSASRRVPCASLAELSHRSDHHRAPPTFKSGAHVGWAGVVSARVTSPPLAAWRHPDLLPPPRDMLSLAGCLTQGTTQLALRWRVKY